MARHSLYNKGLMVTRTEKLGFLHVILRAVVRTILLDLDNYGIGLDTLRDLWP